MTLKELSALDADFISVADAAAALGVRPQSIRQQAREGTLPYPFVRSGNHVKISRIGLLNYLRG